MGVHPVLYSPMGPETPTQGPPSEKAGAQKGSGREDRYSTDGKAVSFSHTHRNEPTRDPKEIESTLTSKSI